MLVFFHSVSLKSKFEIPHINALNSTYYYIWLPIIFFHSKERRIYHLQRTSDAVVSLAISFLRKVKKLLLLQTLCSNSCEWIYNSQRIHKVQKITLIFWAKTKCDWIFKKTYLNYGKTFCEYYAIQKCNGITKYTMNIAAFVKVSWGC